MPKFTDAKNRAWDLTLNVGSLRRIRSMTETDLANLWTPKAGELLDRLVQDPILVCEMVYAVCKPQADAAGLTDEQFYEALAGDCIDQAGAALLEGAQSFCPNPRARGQLRILLDAMKAAMQKAYDLTDSRIGNGQLQHAMEQAVEAGMPSLPPTTSGAPSGDAPESSGSTPTPTPSGNST